MSELSAHQRKTAEGLGEAKAEAAMSSIGSRDAIATPL